MVTKTSSNLHLAEQVMALSIFGFIARTANNRMLAHVAVLLWLHSGTVKD